MTANRTIEETELVEAASRWLRESLPETWTVEPSAVPQQADQAPYDVRPDAILELRPQGGAYATLVVEAKRSFGPRDVKRLMAGFSRLLRRYTFVQFLVVAPWLSERTRELLVEERINYLDLTGNAYLKIDNPPVFIKADGAQRDPSPAPRGAAQVKGPRAARLIRLLADVRPPYGVRDIADAAELNPGYVSRMLDTLDGEALVNRTQRGGVESVDVSGLIRRWAEWYDLFKSNRISKFIARSGIRALVERMRTEGVPDRVVLTGSIAAVRLAPVAGPALLTMYADDDGPLSERFGWLPADQGADVIVLRPFDSVVWERTETEQGVMYAAPSQVAVDCLSGNGRMPSEGEALLSWMSDNEETWRLPSLAALPTRAGTTS